MKRWIAASRFATSMILAGSVLSACAPNSSTQFRAPQGDRAGGIIGGTDVTTEDPISSMTAMLYLNNRQGVCTVSVLNNEWVLSAGHCADGQDVSKMEVVFDLNPGESGTRVDQTMFRKVVEAKVHPKFADTNKALEELVLKARTEGREITTEDVDKVKDWGDVSVLRLEKPIPVSSRAAEILPVGTKFEKGQTIVLSGYGITSSMMGMGFGSGTLRRVEATVEEPIWGTTEILFNQTSGKGACHGDSGGPAYVSIDGKLYLFGVTSRGVRDSQDTCKQFAAYTNLDMYRDWLKEVVGL